MGCVGWGMKRKRKRNAPKANRKPHKALKRRRNQRQRNGIKTRRVCLCNERHTNKWNINRCRQYVSSVLLLQEERRKRKRKRVKGCSTAPLIFLKCFSTNPYFLSLLVCVFGRKETSKECMFAVSAWCVFNVFACKDFSQLKKVWFCNKKLLYLFACLKRKCEICLHKR